MALPGVMYSMNPRPQPFVVSAWTPKFNVSALAGWVVFSVVVEFALPAIDPEPSSDEDHEDPEGEDPQPDGC
jgi:hypothetical protein